MSSFEIIGGKKLKGEIQPQGAKNEALQILCAVLLTPETVTISNIPDIRDVNFLIELLKDMGVKVDKTAPGIFAFQASNIDLEYLRTPEFKKKAASLRGSVMILGPLLSRFKKGYIPHPAQVEDIVTGKQIGRASCRERVYVLV